MKLKLVSNAGVSYFLNNFIKVIFLLPWCGVRAGGAEVGSVMGYGCEAESVIMFFRHFILFLALLTFIYYGIVLLFNFNLYISFLVSNIFSRKDKIFK